MSKTGREWDTDRVKGLENVRVRKRDGEKEMLFSTLKDLNI